MKAMLLHELGGRLTPAEVPVPKPGPNDALVRVRAAGVGLTMKMEGKDSVCIAYFGEGASNTGDFHEAMNFAGVNKLPIVFICENNLYGEYSRIDTTTPFEDLYRRGEAYDIPASAVDGQDIEALLEVLIKTVGTIRNGSGPRFLEVKTYRFSGHSRSDPATYRPANELARWLARDPIDIAFRRLEANGIMDEETFALIRTRIAAEIEMAVEAALASPRPDVPAMFAHIVASPGS